MSANAFEEIEKKFDEIVGLMPDGQDFDSHDFILKFAQKYQQLYLRALSEYADNDQPFQTVHGESDKRRKKRTDLVEHIDNRTSKNIFGLENEAAVWRKVK
jgi:hypothetical protein